MNKKNYTKFHTIFSIIIAFILGGSAATLSYSQVLFEPDEYVTNYLYTYNPLEKADNRITILAIDSASEEAYGNYSDWSRTILADTVSKLTTDQASVIALDVDLSQEKDSEGDNALSAACEVADNVIAMARIDFNENGSELPNNPFGHEFSPTPASADSKWKELVPINLALPYDSLASSVKIGVTNAMQQAPDGSIHSAALTLNYEDQNFESFASIIYKSYQDAHGLSYTLPTLDDQNLFGFNQIWDATSYQIISLADYLSGNYDASMIADHIVLIGEYTATKTANYIDYIRFDRQKSQEILLEANIVQALLTQQIVQTVPPLMQAIIYGFCIALLYLLLVRRRGLIAFILQLVLLGIATTVSYVLNANGYRMLLLVPIMYAFIAFVLSLIEKLIYNIMERRRMERTMKLYMDSQIVDQINDVSPFELASLSERRQVAILFVDIRGFTSLSEELDPAEVVEVLNQYFTVVYASIQAWNGTLDKFIGDAAMAIFNAPVEHDDYVFHAVCAADDIRKGFEPISEAFYEKYHKEIHVGIGVNCGEAIIGNIGCMRRMDYTAIGDTVNTASRLESKAAPSQILVSEPVLNQIQERGKLSFVGALELKGKAKAVDAYQIDELEKPAPPNISARKEFLNEVHLLYSKMGANRQVPEFFEKIQSRI